MKEAQTIDKTNPIDTKEKVQQSNDEHIDQDFKGYPHNPSKENMINPKSKEDKLTARDTSVDNNTQTKKVKKDDEADEINSDGSGGAFNATERLDENNDSEPKKSDESY